ncbi:hypothetical protein [Paenibacillus soyae]|uniref:Uncharacterized protein n=1 Tax=Paenibacillus soyae TaxID=2969249 RepID=A0A9X2SAE0_9BACL|nr:hypothetical protein [Paenibacillus soyae]MCR2806539.1 hypothetical protein [Paenibacillus soyae]
MRVKSIGIFIAVVVVILAAGVGSVQLLKSAGIWNLMQPFTVTVKNETDKDIVIIEAGLVQGESKVALNRTVRSGKTYKFKPDLNVQGENGVYMTHTNADGETVQTSVCGYTESLSGSAKVTVGDRVEVEQDCY